MRERDDQRDDDGNGGSHPDEHGDGDDEPDHAVGVGVGQPHGEQQATPPSGDLRYQSVTLLVPWRTRPGAFPPEDWDWGTVADCVEPVFVASAEDLGHTETVELLTTNGFGDDGDLADEVAP